MGLEQEAKVRENRLRRMADRQGLTLTRSRRRDPRAIDYGLYWLTRGDVAITPTEGVGIDEIDEWLSRPPAPPHSSSPPTG